MRILRSLAILVGLFFNCTTASAVVKKPIPPRVAATSVAPLSVTECLGLGGHVRFTVSLNCSETAQVCLVVDRDGVIHAACIDKLN